MNQLTPLCLILSLRLLAWMIDFFFLFLRRISSTLGIGFDSLQEIDTSIHARTRVFSITNTLSLHNHILLYVIAFYRG